jgi:cytochrome c-type biogenesis protein CcmH
MTPDIDKLREQLRQLDELARQGVLPADQAAQAKARLERELLDLVMQHPAAAPAAAAAATGAAQGTAAAVPARPRPSKHLVSGLVAFVVLAGVLGYTLLGNPAGLSVGPGDAARRGEAAGAGTGAAHDTGNEQIEAMVSRLAERLKAKPDDADGWLMLGRSYSVLKRYPDSAQAFRKAIELRPKDAQAYADLADATGMLNNRSLRGEPEQLIAKALALDGNNLKALALAGTVAFDKGDFALAVKHWEKARAVAEPGNEMAQALEGSVAEARQRAGLPPAPAASQPAGGAAAATAAAPAPDGGRVTGRVTLAAALKGQAGPEDTVFIFARATQGPKMPLAILRKQVKDLPADFQLDDQLAMSPAARLSGAAEVVVGARVSKSGNAVPQPGDLQGLSKPVAPGTAGAQGLQIEIGEAVR